MTAAETTTVDYSDLRALFVNCTLKRSPEVSNTEGLAKISMGILEANGVEVEMIRALDLDVELPETDAQAKQHYGLAVECFQQAEQALDVGELSLSCAHLLTKPCDELGAKDVDATVSLQGGGGHVRHVAFRAHVEWQL